MQSVLRSCVLPLGLALGVRHTMYQAEVQSSFAGQRTEGCPGAMVINWGPVLGCGNFGCAVSVDSGNAVLKVGAKITEKEVHIMSALSALGEGEEGCEVGQLSAETSKPCIDTPNVLHLYGSGTCDCTKEEDLPVSVKHAVVEAAQKRGKKVPNLSTGCSEIAMERVHSDLDNYPGLKSKQKPALARAAVLQTLFAYHIAFLRTGFVHKDIMGDNIALRCVTTWTGNACTAPPRGEKVYCFSFAAGETPYCVDLADTEGTVVVLIDFGLSKLDQASVPRSELMLMRRLADSLKVGLEFDDDQGGATPWAGGAAAYFKDFQPAGGVPANALRFGL